MFLFIKMLKSHFKAATLSATMGVSSVAIFMTSAKSAPPYYHPQASANQTQFSDTKTIQSAPQAGYRTANFTVAAPTPRLAKEIGDTAEHYRKKLALEWLGKSLPNWSAPCPIKAIVAPDLGAGGATSFIFDKGQVFGWDMKIQGSRERVLDSVIPHEVLHTIFASHFRQPVPRWADEGACTAIEHPSEISKQERNLITYLKTNRGIPFSQMFVMKEYPSDVMPLYAQGHSLSTFLIQQRSKKVFVDFITEGMKHENWPQAVYNHYHYENLTVLQNSWLNWIKAGRPRLVDLQATTTKPSEPLSYNSSNKHSWEPVPR